MRVAVISGGRSSEHDVSLRSGAGVTEGLRGAGHEVVEITIDRDGAWSCAGRPVTVTPGEGLLGADAAFPVLHGPFGEDGTVQGLLENAGVAYVGPTVLAAAVTIDKLTFKRVLASEGIAQVGFADGSVGVDPDGPGFRARCERLGLPLWVKPSRLGSSVGIAKVESLAELTGAVENARRHDPRVIVEAHSPGREIEVSLLGNEEVEASVCGEVVARGDWYDFESKYSDGGMDLHAPAELPDTVSDRVRSTATEVYRLTGCTGLARCDFFVEGEDVLVNEINTIPGFTPQSVYAKLFAASGIEYPDLVDRLVNLALDRHEREREFTF